MDSISIILGVIILVSVSICMYEVYQIIKLDAKTRGLKHPTFWVFLASSSNNGGGLIAYLIVRS